MTYTVLQICNIGSCIVLQPANYCESLPNYYRARKAAKNLSFLYKIVRSDRVVDVCWRFKQANNSWGDL